MKVCVIEKNKQIGGNLQTFSRNKQIFDTGVHYIGGLAKGQNLYQIFKYLNIIDKLKLKLMDKGFDKIMFGDDENIYEQSQGYEAFIKNLTEKFPAEKRAIEKYCAKVKDVCSKFPLYHLTLDGNEDKGIVTRESAKQVIESITSDGTLRAVLAGNNLLYTAVAAKTPFHVHALIVNSYIESSWKCVDGGSQIAKHLAANLKEMGSEIIRNCEVKEIVETEGFITHIITERGRKLSAKYFVSNISPASTLSITSSNLLKGLYRKRINELENTVSSFSLYVVFKEKKVRYQNHNYYFHKSREVWNMSDYTDENWPLGYGLYFTQDRTDPQYASSASILTVMRFDDVKPWEKSYNRVGKESERGESYESFKQRKTEQLLKVMEEKFPGFAKNMAHSYVATPLTNRDYIGLHDGSMYGIQKDYNDPVKTMISPRTKIPNLFLTGQNLNLHGILGTSLSAVLTCTMLTGDTSLVDKIRNA